MLSSYYGVVCALRVFQNRLLTIIFAPKRDEVTGSWRKIHKEVLHNMHPSPNIIRMIKPRTIRWAGYIGSVRVKRNAYSVLVRKPNGKSPVEQHRHHLEDNIKIDLRLIDWDVMVWIHLAQDKESSSEHGIELSRSKNVG
jgi:hypothetical protein